MDWLHRLHWPFERQEAAQNPGEGVRLLNLPRQVEHPPEVPVIGFDWPRFERGRRIEAIRSLLFLLRRFLNLIHIRPVFLAVIQRFPAWHRPRQYRAKPSSSQDRKSREEGSVRQ